MVILTNGKGERTMGTTRPIQVQAITTGFDYTQLAPDIRAEVETATRRLHDLERRTSESIIEMGNQLISVKAKIGHGNFLPWIDAEFRWSTSTATKMMQVAETFGDKNVTVTNLGAKVLYALAAPSTPEDVRIEFTELAKTGRAVQHKDVQAAVTKHKAATRVEPIPVQEPTPLRESLGNSQVSTERTYTTKHGTVATMNTENIGRRPVALIDDDVDQGTGEIVAERRRSAPTLADERARMVAIGIVRANGNTFARNVANAILEITVA